MADVKYFLSVFMHKISLHFLIVPYGVYGVNILFYGRIRIETKFKEHPDWCYCAVEGIGTRESFSKIIPSWSENEGLCKILLNFTWLSYSQSQFCLSNSPAESLVFVVPMGGWAFQGWGEITSWIWWPRGSQILTSRPAPPPTSKISFAPCPTSGWGPWALNPKLLFSAVVSQGMSNRCPHLHVIPSGQSL